MNYDQLLHCIRAVANATGENAMYIFGSQSALLHFGELPAEAEESMETDIMTLNNAEDNAYVIAGNFCKDSQFNSTFGLEIDGVLASDIKLEPNWKQRAAIYNVDCYGQ